MLELLDGKRDYVEVNGIFADPNGDFSPKTVKLSRDSFINRIDKYYERLCEIISLLSEKTVCTGF